MIGILNMLGVVASFVFVGLLTRGWVLRIGGLAWIAMGVFAFVAISVDHSNVPGFILAGTFYGSLGVAMWVGGHYVYYRRTHRWKSRLIRNAIAAKHTTTRTRRRVSAYTAHKRSARTVFARSPQ